MVVARVGGIVYALGGKCAHMACPLSFGLLEGHVLTCPCHDWRYDVRSGRFLEAPELGLDAGGRRIGLPSDDTQLAYWSLEQLLVDDGLRPDALAARFASGGRIFGIGATVGRPWDHAPGAAQLLAGPLHGRRA